MPYGQTEGGRTQVDTRVASPFPAEPTGESWELRSGAPEAGRGRSGTNIFFFWDILGHPRGGVFVGVPPSGGFAARTRLKAELQRRPRAANIFVFCVKSCHFVSPGSVP